MMTVFFIGPCVLVKKPAAFFLLSRETEHHIYCPALLCRCYLYSIAGLYSVAKKLSKKKHDCEALVCVSGSDAFLCGRISLKKLIAVRVVLCRIAITCGIQSANRTVFTSKKVP
jgi:hypothetical protein